MIDFTFESPERLWWSFLLLIPIVLHLWRRRRFRQQPWAAMHFILQAVQQEVQKAKLRNLMLMMLRVLILAMFFFAVSAPSTGIHNSGFRSLSSGTHHVLIIDASYSMGTVDGASGKSAFDKAKQRATAYVRSLPTGDVVSILTIGEFRQKVIASPGDDMQQVITAIQDIPVQASGGDLAPVLEMGVEVAESSVRSHQNLFYTRFVVFTDMQRNVWDKVLGAEGDPEEVITQAKKLGDLSIVDCHVDPLTNLAIRDLTVRYPQGAFAADVKAVAEIDCYYKQAGGKVGISWFVDDEFVIRDELEIEAGESATIEIPVSNLSTGSHQIEARLDDDSLLMDNSRWVAFDSPARFRVLNVNGSQNASKAVSLALRPTDSPDWPVFIHTIDEIEFEQQQLEDFDVLALCELNSFSDFNVRRVQGFLNQGGVVLITPGSELNIDSFNTLYGNDLDGQDYGIRWGDIRPVLREMMAAPKVLVTNHEIGNLFQRHPDNGISALPVYHLVELEVAADRKSDIVLELSDGSPLMICTAAGKGHLLTFSTTFGIGQQESRWSDFGAWPSFLPLLHESMKYIVEQEVRTSNVHVGSFPERRVSMQDGPFTVTVQGPDGQSTNYDLEFARDELSGEVFAYWWHSEFTLPGVYYVSYQSEEQIISSSIVVGNLAVTESNHELIDQAVLSEIAETSNDNEQETVAPRMTNRHEWFRELLMAALGLLFLETLWVTRDRQVSRRRKVEHG